MISSVLHASRRSAALVARGAQHARARFFVSLSSSSSSSLSATPAFSRANAALIAAPQSRRALVDPSSPMNTYGEVWIGDEMPVVDGLGYQLMNRLVRTHMSPFLVVHSRVWRLYGYMRGVLAWSVSLWYSFSAVLMVLLSDICEEAWKSHNVTLVMAWIRCSWFTSLPPVSIPCVTLSLPRLWCT